MGAEGAADVPCGTEVAPMRSDGRAAGLSVAQLCQAANSRIVLHDQLADPAPFWFIGTGHGQIGWTMSLGFAWIVADLIGGRAPAIEMSGLGLADA